MSDMAAGAIQTEQRKLLVIDLDETLMFASMFQLPTPPEFRIGLAQAVRRPSVDLFLDRCFSLFCVAAWTSATAEYAADALAHLLPANRELAFVWSRERCHLATDKVSGEQYWIKDANLLAKNGYALDSLLVLDDEPRSWASYSDHVLTVPKFRGDPKDNFLLGLLTVLDEAAVAPNIRAFLRTASPSSGYPNP